MRYNERSRSRLIPPVCSFKCFFFIILSCLSKGGKWQQNFACSDCTLFTRQKTKIMKTYFSFSYKVKEWKFSEFTLIPLTLMCWVFSEEVESFKGMSDISINMGRLDFKSLYFDKTLVIFQGFDQILVIFLSSGNCYSPGDQHSGKKLVNDSYYCFINSKHAHVSHCCLFWACPVLL